MDAIMQANGDPLQPNGPNQQLSNDPYYSQYDPNDPYNPNYQYTRDPSSFVDNLIAEGQQIGNWLANGSETYSPYDGTYQYDEYNEHHHKHDPYSAKSEESLTASIDPLHPHWLDPYTDHQHQVQEDPYHKHEDWLHHEKEKEKEDHDRRERDDAPEAT